MLEVSEVTYQATTLDSGVVEILYEGKDLAEASKAALAHPGKASIHYFAPDGSSFTVQDYENGQATRGYVYHRVRG